jgi:hypothetical protein
MSRPQVVSIDDHASANLRYIRETMERAGYFTAVPGWGGILMGISALIAAAFAGDNAYSGILGCRLDRGGRRRVCTGIVGNDPQGKDRPCFLKGTRTNFHLEPVSGDGCGVGVDPGDLSVWDIHRITGTLAASLWGRYCCCRNLFGSGSAG